MESTSISTKNARTLGMLALALLAALSLAYVWRGAGRMMSMQTQAAGSAGFAQLKNHGAVKIVVEVTDAKEDAKEAAIRGTLLEQRDETHCTRTASRVAVDWGSATKFVMGKADDLRDRAVIHVTGMVVADQTVQASQIVILTGYVHVE